MLGFCWRLLFFYGLFLKFILIELFFLRYLNYFLFFLLINCNKILKDCIKENVIDINFFFFFEIL